MGALPVLGLLNNLQLIYIYIYIYAYFPCVHVACEYFLFAPLVYAFRRQLGT